MIISKVIFNNFRPYYGEKGIDLTVSPDKNIVLIGGRNGHGKTSFLVGMVWCLYGRRVNEVDEIYRKEVKGGYSQYRNKSLNWNARDEGSQQFSVTIDFENVEVPENLSNVHDSSVKVTVHREYNKSDEIEVLQILVNNAPLDLDDEDKVIFIDEYIIPIEAAKFVFFDAEKIAEIAEMNLRQQGRVMNDALGKVLGLNIYEDLIGDLKVARDDLKKKSAPDMIYKQIEQFENALELNNKRLENILSEQDGMDEKIEKLKRDILLLDDFLSEQGGQSVKIDVKELHKRKSELENQKQAVSDKISELAELIPFSIAAGKLQEVVVQIQKQQEISKTSALKDDLEAKKHNFLESLFNQPPYYEGNDQDFKFKQKIFYYDKADELFTNILISENPSEQLDYELDLSKSDMDHILHIYDIVQRTSEEVYDKIFGDYTGIVNKLNETEKMIQQIEGEMEDETLAEYKTKRDATELEKEKHIIKIGELKNQKLNLEAEIKSIGEKKKNLLDKVKASKAKKIFIDALTRYINTLSDFVERQKKEKCEKLAQSVTEELKRLMHKDDFISKAKVRILPGDDGLAVELYDADKQKLAPESLSKGEQQIYISCLLKSILEESVIELPVFIDTPLARLDEEHKNNIMHYYYPNLASQVVIFATNSEISGRKLRDMQNNVTKTYLLNNVNNVTQITEGYF